MARISENNVREIEGALEFVVPMHSPHRTHRATCAGVLPLRCARATKGSRGRRSRGTRRSCAPTRARTKSARIPSRVSSTWHSTPRGTTRSSSSAKVQGADGSSTSRSIRTSRVLLLSVRPLGLLSRFLLRRWLRRRRPLRPRSSRRSTSSCP